MAKILGNDIVSTEEFEKFKTDFLIPYINDNEKKFHQLQVLLLANGFVAAVLLITSLVLFFNK
jgi:hypothetical protein